MGTHREQGANTFWNVAGTLLFQHLCSQLRIAWLGELGRVWSRLHDCCGLLVASCIVLIIGKVDFYIWWLVFPPGLAVTGIELDAVGENDMNTVFQLTV